MLAVYLYLIYVSCCCMCLPILDLCVMLLHHCVLKGEYESFIRHKVFNDTKNALICFGE